MLWASNRAIKVITAELLWLLGHATEDGSPDGSPQFRTECKVFTLVFFSTFLKYSLFYFVSRFGSTSLWRFLIQLTRYVSVGGTALTSSGSNSCLHCEPNTARCLMTCSEMIAPRIPLVLRPNLIQIQPAINGNLKGAKKLSAFTNHG